MDVETFRSQFPEFSSEEAYTTPQVEFWLSIAVLRVNAVRWGDLADQGVALYLAHALTIARANSRVAAMGGNPGQNSGPLSGKTADKLSATYDTAAAAIEGAGPLNLTVYGTSYAELRRMMGLGGAYIGAGSDPYPPGLSSPFLP